jgi:hypothetical protein
MTTRGIGGVKSLQILARTPAGGRAHAAAGFEGGAYHGERPPTQDPAVSAFS